MKIKKGFKELIKGFTTAGCETYSLRIFAQQCPTSSGTLIKLLAKKISKEFSDLLKIMLADRPLYI